MSDDGFCPICMGLDPLALFSLDGLPFRCSIEAMITVDDDGVHLMRFRAIRHRRFWRPKPSEWSGAFAFEGEPIALTWAAFWP